MSAKQQLRQTSEFKASLLFPICSYLALSGLIWLNDGQLWAWQLDSEGFRNYLELYRLPLGVLAMAVPLVAVVSSNHRSTQAAANLQAQQRQNAFSNYYSHLQEFTAFYLSSPQIENAILRLKPEYEPFDPRHIHSMLFPYLRDGITDPDPNQLQVIENANNSTGEFVTFLEGFLPKSSFKDSKGTVIDAQALIDFNRKMREESPVSLAEISQVCGDLHDLCDTKAMYHPLGRLNRACGEAALMCSILQVVSQFEPLDPWPKYRRDLSSLMGHFMHADYMFREAGYDKLEVIELAKQRNTDW